MCPLVVELFGLSRVVYNSYRVWGCLAVPQMVAPLHFQQAKPRILLRLRCVCNCVPRQRFGAIENEQHAKENWSLPGSNNKGNNSGNNQGNNKGNNWLQFCLTWPTQRATTTTAATTGSDLCPRFRYVSFCFVFWQRASIWHANSAGVGREEGGVGEEERGTVGSENDLPVWCQVMRRPWGAAAALCLCGLRPKKKEKCQQLLQLQQRQLASGSNSLLQATCNRRIHSSAATT